MIGVILKKIIGLTLMLMMATCWSAPDTRPEKVDVAIATSPSVISYYSFEIAMAKGYFKDEGLNITRSMFAGGPKAMQALLGGSADVAVSAYANTLNMAAKGQNLQAFFLMIDYPAYAVGVTKAGQTKFKGFESLPGLKVGVTSPGSSTHMVFNAIAHRHGVNVKSYSVIGVGALAGAASAAQTGAIDVLVGIDPVVTMLTNSGDLKIVADLRTGSGTFEALGSRTYPEGSMLASTEFVQKNPKTIQALTNAMLKAQLFLQTASAAEIADSLPKSYQIGERDLYLQAIQNTRSVYSKNGRYDPEGIQTVLKVLTEFDAELAAVQSKIDVSATFTNRFVDVALAAQKR